MGSNPVKVPKTFIQPRFSQLDTNFLTVPDSKTSSKTSALSLGQRLLNIWPYFKDHKKSMVVAGLAMLVAAATEPAIPALLKTLLDEGFVADAFPLWMVPVVLIGLFAIRGAATFVAKYALNYTAAGAMIELRQAMFSRINDADMSLFVEQNSSKLSNTVVYEVQTGANLLVGSIFTLVRDVLTILALLGYLLWLNWQLTLIVLVLFPPLSWVMRVLSKRVYQITRTSQNATDDLAYVVEESVLTHRMLRLHGAQMQQQSRFQKLSSVLRGLSLRATIANAAMTPFSQIIAAAALSAVITIALWQSSTSDVTVGSFVGFVTAMLMLVTPIRHLADIVGPITRGIAALERGMELIENTAVQQGGSHTTPKAQGYLQWQAVGVQYAQKEAYALQLVDLEVRPGEVVALVGPSGSGKTTLVNLLPRFVEVTRGQVLLDGVALPEWDLPNLRQQFAMVSQDVVMLNDTVAANVALGAQLDETRVLKALESANLSSWVASLPQGIHTSVGHNATELSGGQRQRLAIARAVYKDAPILILDEATSALDNESERLVQDALSRLMQGRTTLVIAHRLSTIEHADRVVVLVQGRIVESGTHAQLLGTNGTYSRLHALSSGGSLPA